MNTFNGFEKEDSGAASGICFLKMHKPLSLPSTGVFGNENGGDKKFACSSKNYLGYTLYSMGIFKIKVYAAAHCTGLLIIKEGAARHCTALFKNKVTPARHCNGIFFLKETPRCLAPGTLFLGRPVEYIAALYFIPNSWGINQENIK